MSAGHLLSAAASALALSVVLAGCGEKSARARSAGAQGDAPPEAEAKAAVPEAAPVKRKLVPLRLKLPRPAFISQIWRFPPDVETRSGPRPPVMVPVGTRNVALGKPVTASDRDPIIGEIEQITDGDKEADDESFVELGPGRQWVQVDLGAEHEVHAVLFWHRHDRLVFHDVVVQVADDQDIVIGVKTLFNNDDDNSLGLGVGRDRKYIETYEGKLVEAEGVRARYVRLYSNGSTADEMNRYTEVEVYGRPAE